MHAESTSKHFFHPCSRPLAGSRTLTSLANPNFDVPRAAVAYAIHHFKAFPGGLASHSEGGAGTGGSRVQKVKILIILQIEKVTISCDATEIGKLLLSVKIPDIFGMNPVEHAVDVRPL